MTDDALDRACAGMFASHHMDWSRMAPEGKQWWRGFVIEALRVMADEIRAVHPKGIDSIYDGSTTTAHRIIHICTKCRERWPCPTVRIFDTYTKGYNDEK